MFTYNMIYSKNLLMPIIIRIRLNGLIESYAGFTTFKEAFEWLDFHRKKYVKA